MEIPKIILRKKTVDAMRRLSHSNEVFRHLVFGQLSYVTWHVFPRKLSSHLRKMGWQDGKPLSARELRELAQKHEIHFRTSEIYRYFVHDSRDMFFIGKSTGRRYVGYYYVLGKDDPIE